jgi:hypothetical protein
MIFHCVPLKMYAFPSEVVEICPNFTFVVGSVEAVKLL